MEIAESMFMDWFKKQKFDWTPVSLEYPPDDYVNMRKAFVDA